MGVVDRVLWIEQVDPPAVDDGPPARDADVVVVGAGYAGLSAARVLATAGRSVTVLEKERLGWGAHARNGGMVIPELKSGPRTLRTRYGELGERMYREVNDAFDHVEALATGEIDCDYERTGQLHLAHAARLVPHLRDLAAEHAGEGEDVVFVDRDELAGEIGSTAFHGAIRYARTGGLHPARFHAGLARLARAAGARIHDRCAATRLEREGAGFRVITQQGAIRAQDVVVATNAYADGLLPELRRRVLPISSFIVTTEPLDAATLDAISPRRRMFVDTKNFLFYWRTTPDGRVLFGGRRSLDDVPLDAARAFLVASLRRIHPQLAGRAVTHQWSGHVAITLDRLPHAGRIRGAWYATGCNGSGVATNTWLGHRIGQAILGEAPPPAVAELHHRAIPAHGLRRTWLPAVGSWFRWQDRS
ncbi:MAG: FAD-binding oxidoreductase [Acidimicrobiia bacterium]|nr:FAD-binding oxidoreductase [Acidimicrobiia bacterium]